MFHQAVVVFLDKIISCLSLDFFFFFLQTSNNSSIVGELFSKTGDLCLFDAPV